MSQMSVKNDRQVIAAVSFYLVTSITMVLANKWVLKYLPDLPLLLLWFQIVIAVSLIVVSHASGLLTFEPSSSSTTSDSSTTAPPPPKRHLIPDIDMEKAKKLIPLIAINVVGLSFNTYCLVYIDASMYQVARSLILPLTVIFQYTILKQATSLPVVGACAIVCAGFLSGIFGDRNSSAASIDMRGVMFGLFSSVTTALHSIVIKSSIDVVGGDALVLTWYNNALSAVALFPVVLVTGEFSNLSAWINKSQSTPTGEYNSQVGISGSPLSILVFGSVLTGFFGYLINLAGFFQIKITSPVTHMISSAIRGVLQTFLAVWLFGDILTSGRVLGIMLILFGSSLYTWLKSRPRADDEPKLPA